MRYENFLEPKNITIGGREFCISKIPALQAQELYVDIMKESDGLGNLGFTMLKRDTIKRIFGFVAVKADSGSWVVLDIDTAIDTYCSDLSVLHEVVINMIKENYGFLFNGSLLNLLEALEQK